jgi:hypothetical protein
MYLQGNESKLKNIVEASDANELKMQNYFYAH